ncbi:MAG: SprB repeat-containing protein [Bacteroidales bacterium]|nr:SprB repeat-containing protein [Bacteroidales bacterium]
MKTNLKIQRFTLSTVLLLLSVMFSFAQTETSTPVDSIIEIGLENPNVECNINITGEVSHLTCFGSKDGCINITVTNGTAPIEYWWCEETTSEDICNLKAGSYHVTVTDGNGCQALKTFFVTQPKQILINATVNNVSCNSINDGSIIVSITNGVAPLSYKWSNGETTKDLTNIGAGKYTLTVTDAKGCNVSKAFTITQSPAFTVDQEITNASCNSASNASINLTINSGVAPINFAWSNGAATEDISNIPAGNYLVTISDATGCIVEKSFSITQPEAISIEGTVKNVSCNAGTDGSIFTSITNAVEPITYSWNNGAITSALSAAVAGQYSILATDANGCTAQQTFEISQPAIIQISAITGEAACATVNNGYVDITVIGGNMPYNFNWSNASVSEDLYGIGAGEYTVTVIDQLGCTAVKTATVAQTEAIAIVLTSPLVIGDYNTSCNIDGDGSIEIEIAGGVAPYSIAWSNGVVNQETIENLKAGTYSVLVTDKNGCSATASITLTKPVNCNCTPVIPVPTKTCANCNLVIDGKNWANIPSGAVACITNNYNSGINMTNATLVICGTANISSINFNGANRIIVLGTLNIPSFSINSNTIVIENYGRINVQNWSGMGGKIYNYSTIYFNNGLNINPEGTLENNADVFITGALNVNGKFVNNGYMSVTQPSHVNSGCSFINNCSIDFVDVIINSNLVFKNNGSFTAATTRFNNTVGSFGPGSYIETINLYYTDVVLTNASTQGCNLISVSGITEINHGTLNGTITICDQNGIEKLDALVLKNGASLDCNSCNYEGEVAFKAYTANDINITIEENSALELIVAPAPASANEDVTVTFNSNSFNLFITNTLAQKVYSSVNNSSVVTIEAGTLNTGLNIVKVIDNKTGLSFETTLIIK